MIGSSSTGFMGSWLPVVAITLIFGGVEHWPGELSVNVVSGNEPEAIPPVKVNVIGTDPARGI